ncbi:hypothetical protein CsSME_00029461 [Camellia sinensis var. sinensis]
MSMSLFSSFDALCAEYLGQKVGFSWAKARKVDLDSSAVGHGKKTSSPMIVKESSNKSKEEGKQQRRPRFAPELDGVNCFETIVLY